MADNRHSENKLPINHWLLLLFLFAGFSSFPAFSSAKHQVFLSGEVYSKQRDSFSQYFHFYSRQTKGVPVARDKKEFTENILVLSGQLDQLVSIIFSEYSKKTLFKHPEKNILLFHQRKPSGSPDDLI